VKLRILTVAVLIPVLACSAPVSVPEPSDLAHSSDRLLLESVEAAREEVKRQPESATAWGELGHVYLIHGWGAEAAICYRRAVDIAQGNHDWHYYLGRSLLNIETEEATDALAQTIQLDSTNIPARVYYGDCLIKMARFDEARQQFQQVARLDPKNPYAELRLGQIAVHSEEFELARDYLARSLARNPEQSEAHATMAQVYFALGDAEAARRHGQHASKPTRFTPMQDDLWWNVLKAGVRSQHFADRANVYTKTGKMEVVLAEMEKALSYREDDPALWLYYGTALYGSQRFQETVDALERALDLAAGPNGESRMSANNVSNAHLYLGIVYAREGNPTPAEQHLTQALAINPASVRALNALARFYASQGRTEEASRLMNRASQ
jgi:tetratricopeptide (TPR) repeat protein